MLKSIIDAHGVKDSGLGVQELGGLLCERAAPEVQHPNGFL